ncbi:MAG TPA: peptidylprolyl isomerase [Bryobacteraceae bacterium]|nr:peptidylprolyl isomerase [Bryobacteraceae bacterium]
MKALSILLLACLSAAAQSAPPAPAPPFPNLPESTVIAVFPDGYSMTVGEFKKFFAILPPDAQQNALKQPQDFLRGWAVMRKLAQLAKTQKLDEGSPAREQLDYYTMRILTDAELENVNAHITVPPEEARQYYDTNRERYKEVRLKAIYLGFSDKPASSSSSSASRTEDEAKALAAKLVGQLRGGADFVKLVEQYSEDATSKAKQGDFATIHGSDNIPDQVRSAVMSLKPGEVSEPVRQPTAIYIFQAESVSYKPFDDVSGEIFAQLKKDHYSQWVFQMDHDTKVEFKSPEFFGTAPAGKPPAH